MITVAQAEQIIQEQVRDYGVEVIPFDKCLGRLLAADIKADRDLPPYDRVTMDGIAISYAAFEQGMRVFKIKGTMAAGAAPILTEHADECVELMTGCALPASLDAVIRYEDLDFKEGNATVLIDTIKKNQNIHRRGRDKQAGATVVKAGTLIDATVVSMAASVGSAMLTVKKLPRIVIITTGDELVDVHDTPAAWQIRRSNNYAISAILQQHNISAGMLHIPDDPEATKKKIADCLNAYDVVILSGGISMGKFDHVPQALDELQVAKLFHKVQQRPGKPFWFGVHERGTVVFAFPGNPVSAFMCMNRYFLPWLRTSMSLPTGQVLHAVLNNDITFEPALQYFLQVALTITEQGQLMATPAEGNGSGDFANLLDVNAFMELPAEKSQFKRGEIYKVWPFKKLI